MLCTYKKLFMYKEYDNGKITSAMGDHKGRLSDTRWKMRGKMFASFGTVVQLL